jgi:hypothetical protein
MGLRACSYSEYQQELPSQRKHIHLGGECALLLALSSRICLSERIHYQVGVRRYYIGRNRRGEPTKASLDCPRSISVHANTMLPEFEGYGGNQLDAAIEQLHHTSALSQASDRKFAGTVARVAEYP